MNVKFNHFFFDSKQEFVSWLITCNLRNARVLCSSSRYEGYDWYRVNRMSCYVPIAEQLEMNF